jgi:hypothetical protein
MGNGLSVMIAAASVFLTLAAIACAPPKGVCGGEQTCAALRMPVAGAAAFGVSFCPRRE